MTTPIIEILCKLGRILSELTGLWLIVLCRKAMDKIVEILIEKETISGDEFRAILSEYTQIPEENLAAVRRSQELQLA